MSLTYFICNLSCSVREIPLWPQEDPPEAEGKDRREVDHLYSFILFRERRRKNSSSFLLLLYHICMFVFQLYEHDERPRKSLRAWPRGFKTERSRCWKRGVSCLSFGVLFNLFFCFPNFCSWSRERRKKSWRVVSPPMGVGTGRNLKTVCYRGVTSIVVCMEN